MLPPVVSATRVPEGFAGLLISCPLVGCGVAAHHEVVEPPTLAGRRLIGAYSGSLDHTQGQ